MQTIKRADATANRLRILEAARATFAEHGVHADVKLVADRAGLGVGTIYRNFPGKNDLLLEVCRRLGDDVALGLIAGEDEPDPIDGLRVCLISVFRIATDYGWLMHAKINQQLPAEVQKTLRPPHTDPRYQPIFRILDRAREAGQIRPDLDPQILGTLLFASIWPLRFRLPADDPRSPEDLATQLLDIVLNGAKPRLPEERSMK